ncbi:MAG: type IV pilus modification protein PilV [Betaproteobacteria bacterium]|nr:type IV pilus modification protein PilV [Betaproteobacteria bacterium]
MHMIDRQTRPAQGGFSLLEVIITMAILAVGLLGLAGLQARALNAEVESFSRAQAMMLANELVNRMGSNLAEVKTSTSAGTGYNRQDGGGVKEIFGAGYSNDCISVANNTPALQASCCAAKATIAARDLCEWDLALKGIGEAVGTSKVGAMSEARACVFNTGTAGVFQIDVVWQSRDIGVVSSDNSCGSAAITTRRSGVSRVLRVAVLNGT